MLLEDPELVVAEQQHQDAVQRVGEYAMGLLGNCTASAELTVSFRVWSAEVVIRMFLRLSRDVATTPCGLVTKLVTVRSELW